MSWLTYFRDLRRAWRIANDLYAWGNVAKVTAATNHLGGLLVSSCPSSRVLAPGRSTLAYDPETGQWDSRWSFSANRRMHRMRVQWYVDDLNRPVNVEAHWFNTYSRRNDPIHIADPRLRLVGFRRRTAVQFRIYLDGELYVSPTKPNQPVTFVMESMYVAAEKLWPVLYPLVVTIAAEDEASPAIERALDRLGELHIAGTVPSVTILEEPDAQATDEAVDESEGLNDVDSGAGEAAP